MPRLVIDAWCLVIPPLAALLSPLLRFQTDDIQYFAPGPEFKLSREAAAMKAYNADLEAQQRGQ